MATDGRSDYTLEQMDASRRLTLSPWQVSLHTTAPELLSFSGGVENKLILANIISQGTVTGWQVVVTSDGPATQFIGNDNGDTYRFTISIGMSVESTAGGAETTFKLFKRNADQTFAQATAVPGVNINRTFQNNSIGVMGKNYSFEITEGQLLDFSVMPTGNETLNFVDFSADILERA